MRFQLTPRSMTLDDLKLYKFEFSENFSGFRMQQRLKIYMYCQWQRCNTSNWSSFWHAFT